MTKRPRRGIIKFRSPNPIEVITHKNGKKVEVFKLNQLDNSRYPAHVVKMLRMQGKR